MHPEMTGTLASQHRHEMSSKASHHAQAALAAYAGPAAEARSAVPVGPAFQVARAGRPQAAASPRGPRRGVRRPHLPAALLPRYRVSWSRTALAATAADGAGRGHSWVIVISATRTL